MTLESDEDAFYQLFACCLIDGVLGEAEFSYEKVIATILEEAKQKIPKRFDSAKRHFILIENGFGKEKIKEDIANAGLSVARVICNSSYRPIQPSQIVSPPQPAAALL